MLTRGGKFRMFAHCLWGYLGFCCLENTDGSSKKGKNRFTIGPNNSTTRYPKQMKEEFKLPAHQCSLQYYSTAERSINKRMH